MAPSAQNNKQVASDSEVDVEKGRSSQLLTPYPDYQATYRIETLAAAGSQRRRKARFLHAFGFSVFLVLFLHFTAKDISRFVRTVSTACFALGQQLTHALVWQPRKGHRNDAMDR